MSSEQPLETQPTIESEEEQKMKRVDTMTDEEILAAIRKQVEYYFSKENLQNDKYLTTHMDANMSVPISIIMKFPKIESLTKEESVLQKALENSSVTLIEGGRLKANVKVTGRSTIILREIPSDAPEEEVREIFNYEGCKPISSMHSDIGDTWFVLFESEEDAKDVLIELRLKKRTFRGQQAKGRMKTEATVRSFYPMPAVPSVLYPANAIGPGVPVYMGVPPLVPAAMYSYGLLPGQMINPALGILPNQVLNSVDPEKLGLDPNGATDGKSIEAGADDTPGEKNGQAVNGFYNNKHFVAGAKTNARGIPYGSSSQQQHPQQLAGNAQNAKQTKDARVGDKKAGQVGVGGAAQNASQNSSSSSSSSASSSSGAGGTGGNNSVNNNRKNKAFGGANATAGPGRKFDQPVAKPSPPIEISSANFPPLSSTQADDSSIPSPGYKGNYRKYSSDNILDIVRKVAATNLPDSIKPEEHPLAMNTTANLELLRRQRSASIEETREHLQQGRPVQREAIIAGAVDYVSMMFGDAAASDQQQHDGAAAAITLAPQATTNIPFSKNSWAALVKSTPDPVKVSTPPSSSATKSTPPATATEKSSKASHSNKKSNAAKASASSQSSASTSAAASASAADAPQTTTASTGDHQPAADSELVFISEGDETTAALDKSKGVVMPLTTGATASNTAGSIGALSLAVPPATAATAPSTSGAPTPGSVSDPAPTSDRSAATPTSGWGGKLSFANVLKQQAAEVSGVSGTTTPNSSNAAAATLTMSKGKSVSAAGAASHAQEESKGGAGKGGSNLYSKSGGRRDNNRYDSKHQNGSADKHRGDHARAKLGERSSESVNDKSWRNSGNTSSNSSSSHAAVEKSTAVTESPALI